MNWRDIGGEKVNWGYPLKRNQVPDITGIIKLSKLGIPLRNQVPDITGIIKLSKLKGFFFDLIKCLILLGL